MSAADKKSIDFMEVPEQIHLIHIGLVPQADKFGEPITAGQALAVGGLSMIRIVPPDYG